MRMPEGSGYLTSDQTKRARLLAIGAKITGKKIQSDNEGFFCLLDDIKCLACLAFELYGEVLRLQGVVDGYRNITKYEFDRWHDSHCRLRSETIDCNGGITYTLDGVAMTCRERFEEEAKDFKINPPMGRR